MNCVLQFALLGARFSVHVTFGSTFWIQTPTFQIQTSDDVMRRLWKPCQAPPILNLKSKSEIPAPHHSLNRLGYSRWYPRSRAHRSSGRLARSSTVGTASPSLVQVDRLDVRPAAVTRVDARVRRSVGSIDGQRIESVFFARRALDPQVVPFVEAERTKERPPGALPLLAKRRHDRQAPADRTPRGVRSVRLQADRVRLQADLRRLRRPFDEWLEHRLDDECRRSILVTLPFFNALRQERLSIPEAAARGLRPPQPRAVTGAWPCSQSRKSAMDPAAASAAPGRPAIEDAELR